MAMKTDQIKLPVSVATEIVNKAKDTSTIASLSPSTPQIFSDATTSCSTARAKPR